jgi:anti-sigma-K factor RskA
MSGGGKSLRTCGATSNNTAASAHGLDCLVVGGSQRNERNFMMNHTDGWMGGWSGGGMWIWAVIGVAVVVLLVVVIGKMSKK